MKQMQLFPEEKKPIRRYYSYTKPTQPYKEESESKDYCPECKEKLKNEATGFRCLKCGYYVDRY